MIAWVALTIDSMMEQPQLCSLERASVTQFQPTGLHSQVVKPVDTRFSEDRALRRASSNLALATLTDDQPTADGPVPN